MSLSLKGKTALVTGSSRGIGRAIAERLAAEGAAVVIHYARNEQPAQAVVNNILGRGGKAVAVQADISKPGEIRRLFGEAEKALGHLDIVVANAGVHIEKPLVENTEADYDYIFDTNTKGVFFTLQEAARRVRDGGRIVVVSTGGTKMHFANMSLYLGSKGAIEQFARSLALELGPRNYRKRAVTGIHRYRHAPRAVPRIRRESVTFQSCRRAGGCGRRGHVSSE